MHLCRATIFLIKIKSEENSRIPWTMLKKFKYQLISWENFWWQSYKKNPRSYFQRVPAVHAVHPTEKPRNNTRVKYYLLLQGWVMGVFINDNLIFDGRQTYLCNNHQTCSILSLHLWTFNRLMEILYVSLAVTYSVCHHRVF